MDTEKIKEQVRIGLEDLITAFPMDQNHILIIGTSTSEVIGKNIGSSGSEEVAEAIFSILIDFKTKYNFHLAFQGCEHINRALTVERETANKFGLEVVTVVPVKKAGGAMSTYAYHQMEDPVVVEFIKADAGMDIGDTLIGMHLKHVAVPIRSRLKKVGEANLTMAKTRPKLIGGIRAQYTITGVDPSSIIKDVNELEKTKAIEDGESC